MRRAGLLLAALLACAPVPALAVRPDEIMADHRLEARARDLSTGLRCMVCQNQSIDDSDATLARDIRVLVRERLRAGDTDAQIRSFLVQRYGAFILLKPPVEAGTLLLWGTPFLALLLGGTAIAYATRQARSAAPGSAGPSSRCVASMDMADLRYEPTAIAMPAASACIMTAPTWCLPSRMSRLRSWHGSAASGRATQALPTPRRIVQPASTATMR